MEPESAPTRVEWTEGQWRDDVLPDYERAPLGPATLIRRIGLPTRTRGVVLHVHGYNDYFFTTHVADALTEMGLAFYAVDMRRAGRSLTPGDKPHHITDIAELGEDITAASAAALADAKERTGEEHLPLVIHAHSTGGLAAAIWASDTPHPDLAALVLNSPFFGLMLRPWERYALAATPTISRLRAGTVLARVPSPYSVALRDKGGWVFDPQWKKPGGEPATAGWLAATRAAQRRVARGLDIRVPVLVARSDSSGPDRDDNPRHQSQDVVVDTALIEAWAPGLGSDVRDAVVEGAVHDLSLSAEGPRRAFFDAVGDFVDTVLE
ncbi:alpha/beta hydrolase [Demequina muriae]|uniref:Alpha/beta hydrolase n=1 Tax=Demequina muriae TaxID=3051664 RepID=A0ABT8GGF9_9MICO|nr:alpha/beta hydrolase [Demequina sp. EGI L300058]MDN4480512.1 alpha/beta hydrolase [Demequina sp. EGI L300058]